LDYRIDGTGWFGFSVRSRYVGASAVRITLAGRRAGDSIVGFGMTGEPIRICLVDDHEIVRHGLVAMLAPFASRVAVVATAATVGDAIRAVRQHEPDIVLTDMRLGNGSGLDLCASVKSVSDGCRVVFLTVYDDEQYLFQALRVGGSGYLLKQVGGHELVRYLEDVGRGEIVIDPALAGRIAASAARVGSGEFWPGARRGLTQRESEVLSLLVAGLTNRAIGRRLAISDDTVKSHLGNLYRKLEVGDRSAAVAIALREGLFH
jgi:DNA-binding NarL/FixJ family response regulator